MPITRTQGPSGGASVVSQAVIHLRRSNTPFGHLHLMSAPVQPKITQPLPLYSLQLDDIVDEDFPQRVRFVGWRYLVIDSGSIAAADVGPVGDKFHRLMHGRHAAYLMSAVKFAEDNFGTATDDYKLRILEIPVLYVAALWLLGSDDKFIPFLDASQEVAQPGSEFAPQIDESFIFRIVEMANAKRDSMKKQPPPDTDRERSN